MELVSKPDHDHMVFSRLSQEQSLVELKVLEYNMRTLWTIDMMSKLLKAETPGQSAALT